MNDQNKSDEQSENPESPENDTDVRPAEAEPSDVAPAYVATEVPQYAVPAASGAATEEPAARRRWMPSTQAGKSRLVAAGIAGAFFLGGGLGGFAIGQANDGPDRGGVSRPGDFDGRGPGGGPAGGPGQQQGPQQDQQAPGSTSGSGTAS